ncbi:MAG: class I SAM-dependent methyltransferase [Candidatus Eiseniibacteriota bacterium]
MSPIPSAPQAGDEHDERRAQFLAANPVALADAGNLAEFEREWSRIATLVPPARPLHVLDIGAGSGRWSIRWVEHGARVTAVDFDYDLLGIARRRPGLEGNDRDTQPTQPARLAQPAVFQCAVADATRLPFAADRFDIATLNSLLEHVPDWHASVAEAARVLAPGGVLVLHTSNRWHPFQGEVNNFPFYPWLPEPVKQRVLAWIMEHRRDLVNYTDYPAIHWFSYPGLKVALRGVGLEPFDRLDLTDPASLTGVKAFGRFMLRSNGREPRGRSLYYFLAGTVSLYARKPLR